MSDARYDFVVIGGGPAGQHAAMHAAGLGQKVLLVERSHAVGGSCVSLGTIPSKTLRETALALTGFRRKTADLFPVVLSEDLQVASLMTRLDQVIAAHQRYMGEQVRRCGADRWHGRARFVDATHVEVQGVDGHKRVAEARFVVLCPGSRPRTPKEVPVDHAHILDSDSLLSMTYLPKTLTVLGAGVIATEYASIFASLGTTVTMVDKGPRPLGFLDPELVVRWLDAFHAGGHRYIGGTSATAVEHDGFEVVATLGDGQVLRSEKLLCALGRVANLDGLDLGNAGLQASDRGIIPVGSDYRTTVPTIFAAGDVIGPPSLASASQNQGRCAVDFALGRTPSQPVELIPMGIYAIPEMSQIGLTEEQARQKHGGAIVGRAPFSEVARGQIAAIQDGLLKLVAAPDGRKLLGVQVVGEGAAELVSIGQTALLVGADVDLFADNTYNFPTMAEAYRVAALEIVRARGR